MFLAHWSDWVHQAPGAGQTVAALHLPGGALQPALLSGSTSLYLSGTDRYTGSTFFGGEGGQIRN